MTSDTLIPSACALYAAPDFSVEPRPTNSTHFLVSAETGATKSSSSRREPFLREAIFCLLNEGLDHRFSDGLTVLHETKRVLRRSSPTPKSPQLTM
jgi:hypothetical protein